MENSQLFSGFIILFHTILSVEILFSPIKSKNHIFHVLNKRIYLSTIEKLKKKLQSLQPRQLLHN